MPQDQSQDSPRLPSTIHLPAHRVSVQPSLQEPAGALPRSPFSAVFYKAVSVSSWVKTPDKLCRTILAGLMSEHSNDLLVSYRQT